MAGVRIQPQLILALQRNYFLTKERCVAAQAVQAHEATRLYPTLRLISLTIYLGLNTLRNEIAKTHILPETELS